jgi:pilus assembly protein CpaF
VENDVIETETIFVREADRLVRGRGVPPRAERFDRAGLDVHRILAGMR